MKNKLIGTFLVLLIIGLGFSPDLKAQSVQNEVLVLDPLGSLGISSMIRFYHDQNGFSVQSEDNGDLHQIKSSTTLYAKYQWSLIQDVAILAGVDLKAVYTVTYLGGHSGWYVFCNKNKMVLGDAIFSPSPDNDSFYKYKVLSRNKPLPISNPH